MMNIIYIEDDPQDRKLVERYISATPHRLTAVTKPDELDDDTLLSVDLILLDMLFDGKSLGLDYLQDMRAHGIECPVVAVTALPQQSAAYEEAGIDLIIEKPFEIMELASAIARFES